MVFCKARQNLRMSYRDRRKRQWRKQKREERRQREGNSNGDATDKMSDSDTEIAWIGGNEYRVFSKSDERGMNSYLVDLTDGSCECEHGEHNEGNTDACKHIRLATEKADEAPETDGRITMSHIELVQSALGIMDDARDTVQAAESAKLDADIARETVDDARQAATAMESEAAQQTLDPEEKAEKLQEEFEANNFDVHFVGVDGTEINFSLGHDKFDFLKSVTSQAGLVNYDGDANVIEAGDVDEYIEKYL